MGALLGQSPTPKGQPGLTPTLQPGAWSCRGSCQCWGNVGSDGVSPDSPAYGAGQSWPPSFICFRPAPLARPPGHSSPATPSQYQATLLFCLQLSMAPSCRTEHKPTCSPCPLLAIPHLPLSRHLDSPLLPCPHLPSAVPLPPPHQRGSCWVSLPGSLVLLSGEPGPPG